MLLGISVFGSSVMMLLCNSVTILLIGDSVSGKTILDNIIVATSDNRVLVRSVILATTLMVLVS